MAYLLSAGTMVAGLGAVLWHGLSESPSTYRYRMTVEIETPDGPRTGSAVRELVYRKAPRLSMEAKTFILKERGEAVAVDLPGGQAVFALLDENAADTIIAGLGGGDRRRPVKDLLDRGGSGEYPDRAVLRQSYLDLPQLVRFRDLRDPTSMESLAPDDLEPSLGAGVRIKRVGIQITGDPVTEELTNRLPWLLDLDRYRADPTNPFTSTLPPAVGRLRSR